MAVPVTATTTANTLRVRAPLQLVMIKSFPASANSLKRVPAA